MRSGAGVWAVIKRCSQCEEMQLIHRPSQDRVAAMQNCIVLQMNWSRGAGIVSSSCSSRTIVLSTRRSSSMIWARPDGRLSSQLVLPCQTAEVPFSALCRPDERALRRLQ
ncbi:hypothetical protein LIA77_02698 [Sarocladium implicatum]|nr:hypothetical protein LIA77_02698 [Sarocladium implicatum]